MILKKGTLLILVITLVVITNSESIAQKTKKRKKAFAAYSSKKPTQADQFMRTQWWLGFKAGGSITKATPTERYSAFSPVNYEQSFNEKTYEGFKHLGGNAGLEITFFHNGLSLSFQPNYRRQTFSYENTYAWVSTTDASNGISLTYKQQNQLDYIELPLLVKYDLTRGNLRPFIQAGFFYATLSSAKKTVEVTGEDLASGAAGQFANESFIIGAEEVFINSSTGALGGVGVTYDFWNMRLIFDASYRHGFNNITSDENRYTENQLSGIGDAADEVTLENISFNLGFLFPLRFISDGSLNPVR